MKIFLDSTDITVINSRLKTGLIDGVTTNPTLVHKAGKQPHNLYKELIDLGINDISIEVVGQTKNVMLDQALALLKQYGSQVTIKLPCTIDGLMACKELSSKHDARVNVTLVFTAAQALLSAKAGASYISPFVGRLNDQNSDGIGLIKEIKQLFTTQNIYRTAILAASIRTVNDAVLSYANGADIVTMPPNIFDNMYNSILTDKGLEQFEHDNAVTVREYVARVPRGAADTLPCEYDPE